jgi:hypothetical protein
VASVVQCRSCATANDRRGGRRLCTACGATLPRKRRHAHANVLTGDSYPQFVEASILIHGVADESCCVCRKPRPDERRWDRDHGHRKGQPDYGKPRGLVCGGNAGCNVLMLPWVSAPVARAVHLAKLEALEPDAERWCLIADYLERVAAYYGAAAAAAAR